MKKIFVFIVLVTFTHAGAGGIEQKESYSELLKNFEKYCEKAMNEWETPGMAISVVKDDKVIYSKGFGVTVYGGNEKIDPHTIFQIGSISKSFTTTLLGMAVDEKTLDWNDRVVDMIPTFMLYDPWVTREYRVVDTVAQRSGLKEYSLDEMVILGFKKPEILRAMRYVKPVTSFRSKYAYQNTFFLFAADILEAKTGSCWGELVRQRIFEPLQMTESSFASKSYLEAKNVSWLHYRDPFGKIHTIKKPFDIIEWTYTYAPAGGINSNCLDMANYAIMQMNQGLFRGKQIISAENVKFLQSPEILAMQRETGYSYYCLGWVYTEYSPYPFIWHTGGTSGAATILAFIPQDKIGIVVLTNEAGTTLPNALAMQFFDMYYEKPDQDWSRKLLEEKIKKEKEFTEKNAPLLKPYPSLPLEKYAGNYRDEVLGDAQVAVVGENLVVTMGPNSLSLTLKHHDRDRFSLFFPEMDEYGQNKVVFTLEQDQIPDTMVFEAFAPSGYGIFKRNYTKF